MSLTETIVQHSEALWQEPNLDQLMRRFVRLLKDDFGVDALSILHLEGIRPLKWSQEELNVKGVKNLSETVLTDLHQDWQFVDFRDQEYRDGLHDVRVGEATCQFMRLGEQKLGQIMVWSTPAKADESQRTALDFLVRQMQGMARLLEKLDQTQELLHRDGLTGLFNYRYLDISLDAEIRRAQRFQSKFCLLFIDLDNFKPINDRHGHLSGSEVIRQVADVLREDVREVDSVFRYGGDEYVVLLLEANATTGTMTAERIRKRIEATPFKTEDGQTVFVTASIGVAACPDHGLSKESLLRMADQSMYKCKNGGKNRVFVVNREALAEIEAK